MFPELSATLGPIYFWMFAVVSVACATGVLCMRHPIQGAVSLVGVMLSLAGIYALLHSPFLAVLQVLVYAGAIMMLLVFVIMILNHGEDHRLPRFDKLSILGLLLPLGLGAIVVATLHESAPALTEAATTPRMGIETIASNMFDIRGQGWYILFEIAGLLLLTAVVGAVLLAKRSLERTAEEDPDPGNRHGHGGHADRGASVVAVHDRAAAGSSTVVDANQITDSSAQADKV